MIETYRPPSMPWSSRWRELETELLSVQEKLGMFATYAGCNSYGQIVRVDGQFSGFHNCTAVVAVFPE